MQPLDALEALARLAATDTTERGGALSEATRIVGAVVESSDVRVFVGDGINFEAYPRREAEDFFQLSPNGLISLSQALRSLRGAAVHVVSRDGLPADIAPADGQGSGDYIAIALWIGDSYGGTLVARGPWETHSAAPAGRFLEAARPVLSAVLEHVVDADRVARLEGQMNALANVARVFNQTGSLREALGDLVRAINGATGLLSSIDVLDARGRIAVRSTAASRFTGTPLHQAWLDMIRAPDPIRKMILKDHQPVFLPDLQSDPRIAEEARLFYRRASLVSAATFPLLFQDEVVGLLRVASLKPASFASPVADLLQNLALQSAVVVKGIRLWEQLQRSRKQAERYAAKLSTRNQQLLAEVSERERAEAALRAVVSNTPVVLFSTDTEGTFTLSEGRGLELLGLHPGEVVGQSLYELYSPFPTITDSVRRVLTKGETLTVTSEVGELFWEIYYSPILGQRGRVEGLVGVATDVTLRARALERETQHARRDALTGVLNHGAITAYLAEQMGRAGPEHVAVAMVDVDGMKAVNDTYGHLSGDAALRAVTVALAGDGAVVGRYGGDEFMVVLAGADRDSAEAYCGRAASDIRECTVTDEATGNIIRVPASIGMAVYPDEAATLAELVAVADRAMYAAKTKGALGRGGRRREDRVSDLIADLVPLLTSPGDLDEKLKLVGARLSTATGYDVVECVVLRSHGQPAEGGVVEGVSDAAAEGWRAEQQLYADMRQRPINIILARTRRPVIVEDLSCDDRITPAERALAAQAGLQSGVIAPMLWNDELAGSVAVLSKRKAAFDARDAELLAAVATQVAAIVRMTSLVDGLQSATERLSDAQAHTVLMLAAAAEAHDHTNGLHLESVREFTEAIAREMGYGEEAVRDLGLAATLHDIGKIRVPDNILASPQRFDVDDWEVARIWDVLKQHSVWGAEFLGPRPEFALAAKVARWHHERWDGKGYPDGIAGEQIPEEVTIVTVADAFDAIVQERPYRAARPVEEALAEIVRCRGAQFNPAVVDALVGLHERGALPGQADDPRMAA